VLSEAAVEARHWRPLVCSNFLSLEVVQARTGAAESAQSGPVFEAAKEAAITVQLLTNARRVLNRMVSSLSC
jgi:hypothetical protein